MTYRNLLSITLGLCIALSFAAPSFATNVKQLFEMATMSYSQGDLDGAESLYKKVLQAVPEFPQAYNALGMVYLSRGNLSEAARNFEIAIGLNPDYVQAYQSLCQTYYKGAQFKRAVDACQEALDLNPDFFEGRSYLAWGYLLGLSQAHEAIDYFQQVLEIKEDPTAYYGLGLALLADGQRLSVFDCITKLKQFKLYEMADKLEELMRVDRDYVLKEGGQLVQKAQAEEFSYQGFKEDQLRKIPVRLSGPLPTQ